MHSGGSSGTGGVASSSDGRVVKLAALRPRALWCLCEGVGMWGALCAKSEGGRVGGQSLRSRGQGSVVVDWSRAGGGSSDLTAVLLRLALIVASLPSQVSRL